jgi:aryl-alcohol dehydrogenase-like predicted oxidoreductase
MYVHLSVYVLTLAIKSQALPLLKAAYDRGLNTWDTANVYSNGVSEEIVGKAIKKYNIPREKVVILTKCHFAVGEEPGTFPPSPSHALPFLSNMRIYIYIYT